MATTSSSQAPARSGPESGSSKDPPNASSIRRANLRVKTLEIRWHDSKPISSCDFQPRPLKRTRSIQQAGGSGSSSGTPQPGAVFSESCYKLATGGEDNHVRVSCLMPLYRTDLISESNLNLDMDGLSKHITASYD